MEFSVLEEIRALLTKHGIGSNDILAHEIAILVLEHEKETMVMSYKGFIKSLEVGIKERDDNN